MTAIHRVCYPIETRAAPKAGERTPAEPGRERSSVHRVRIMTGAVARDGDIVDPTGMSLEHYLRNPVVLWAHDATGRTESAGLPVGRTLSLERRAECIEADFEFLPGDPFAQRVQNAWERGFLRSASIGWRSLETAPLPGGRGLCHRKTELLEWSLVPVPADPLASRELYLAGMRSLGFGDLVHLTPWPPSPPGKGEAFAGAEALLRAAQAARALAEALRHGHGPAP